GVAQQPHMGNLVGCHCCRHFLRACTTAAAIKDPPRKWARGSRLLVVRGKPVEVLPRLMKDWAITQLCFEVH
ncbi:cryptochrome 2 (photolyase-like), partial [Haematococcus lacustris]